MSSSEEELHTITDRFTQLSLQDSFIDYTPLHTLYFSTIHTYKQQLLSSKHLLNPMNIPRYSECIRSHLNKESVHRLQNEDYTQSLYQTFDLSHEPTYATTVIPIIRNYLYDKYGSLHHFFIADFVWDNPFVWNTYVGVESSLTQKQNINHYFEEVVKQNYEFIILPIAKQAHHILTLLHTRTKQIYIFETYGTILYSNNTTFAFTIPQIHYEITQLEVFREYSLHPFNTQLPKTFVQYYAEKYGTNKHYWADPCGYCVYWSWFTIDYVLSHPSFHTQLPHIYKQMEQDVSTRIHDQTAEGYGLFLSEFIRDYYIGIRSISRR